MAKIRIQCSECQHEARVPESFRGRKVRCLRCKAKLRVPEDAPYVEPKQKARKAPKRPSRRPADEPPRPRRGREPQANRGGPSSKTRRESMGVIRELLHEYDHAIESVDRGYEIDLRGVAFGLARTLVEEMLLCTAVRDVKLAGGTGQSRLVVTLQGYKFDPDDSFAEEDEDTEVFQRKVGADDDWAPSGLLDDAVDADGGEDPAWKLDGEVPVESQMQSVFTEDATTRTRAMDPISLFEQARSFMEDGEPRQAISLLEKAVAIDKKFGRAVHALGKAYASAGEYNRARRAFRHLTKLDSDDPEAFVLHAAAAVRCERLDEARHALKTAIKLDPEYKQAYRYAAQLYERMGEPETARKFRARYQALKLRG